jgi:hypothetical protein
MTFLGISLVKPVGYMRPSAHMQILRDPFQTHSSLFAFRGEFPVGWPTGKPPESVERWEKQVPFIGFTATIATVINGEKA